MRDRFNLHQEDFEVVPHFPEQFFVVFKDPAVRRRAVNAGVVPFRGHDFRFAAWTERHYSVPVEWEFHVKVRVEGIPVHCWSEDVATRALGRSCTVHHVQERSRRRERTRSFDLWA